MASTSDASPAPPASPVPSTWISGCNRAPSPVAPAEATAAAGGEAAPERGGVNGVVAAGASASVWDPAASVGRNPTGELDGVGRMAVGLTIGGDEPDWVRSSTGTKLLGGGCTWRGSSCATRAGPGIAVCARWLGGGGGRRGGVTGSRRAKKASWGVCPDRSAVGGARGSLMGSAAAAPSARCTHAPTPSSRGSPAGRLDLRMSTEPDRCASACCSRASRSAVQSTIHTRASNPKRTLSPCRSASRWPLIRTLLMKQPLSEPRSRSDAARPASLTSISACSPDTDRDLSTRSEPGCRPMEYDRPASRGSAWVSEVR
mmetsp:Transcript_22666/g.71191  ORF Transcript_22666/g.71191 Transcript_22666/m.71191 type:complete len:316 (+) Transcript_22666:205-1152(+)